MGVRDRALGLIEWRCRVPGIWEGRVRGRVRFRACREHGDDYRPVTDFGYRWSVTDEDTEERRFADDLRSAEAEAEAMLAKPC